VKGQGQDIEEMIGKSVEHFYEKQGPKVVIYPIEGHNHAVVLQKSRKKDFRDLVHEDGSIHLIPDSDGHCVCGVDWLEETELECTRIISATDMLHAKGIFFLIEKDQAIYIRNCSSCDRFKDYGGIEDQLLNMGVYLISHDLLRKYLHQFITEGKPLISFYQ
ncbi:hypothetical protein DPMN_035820, partial [Dreissena polymorpha]